MEANDLLAALILALTSSAEPDSEPSNLIDFQAESSFVAEKYIIKIITQFA